MNLNGFIFQSAELKTISTQHLYIVIRVTTNGIYRHENSVSSFFFSFSQNKIQTDISINNKFITF